MAEDWRYPLVNLVLSGVNSAIPYRRLELACRDNRDFLGSDKRLWTDEKTRPRSSATRPAGADQH